MSYRNNRNRNSGQRYNNNRNRSRSTGFGQRRPVELHKATCAKCKEETEVPFKPDGSRPVYCRDCYQQIKPRKY
jgi:CxxC-x17-CxxC domain-containing protein